MALFFRDVFSLQVLIANISQLNSHTHKSLFQGNTNTHILSKPCNTVFAENAIVGSSDFFIIFFKTETD